jgi:hypothetical protein
MNLNQAVLLFQQPFQQVEKSRFAVVTDVVDVPQA